MTLLRKIRPQNRASKKESGVECLEIQTKCNEGALLWRTQNSRMFICFPEQIFLKSVNVSDLVGKFGSYSNPVIIPLTWPSLAIGLKGISPVPVTV